LGVVLTKAPLEARTRQGFALAGGRVEDLIKGTLVGGARDAAGAGTARTLARAIERVENERIRANVVRNALVAVEAKRSVTWTHAPSLYPYLSWNRTPLATSWPTPLAGLG
jgi:hypothetical protein